MRRGDFTTVCWAAVGSCCILAALGEASNNQAATARSAPGSFFFEPFGPGWEQRWHYSAVKKYRGAFHTVQPVGYQDAAIQMPEGNVHYGLTAMLPEPLIPADGIVVQYEVQFAQGHTCGGAYLKLLSQTEEGFSPSRLKSKTPFSIMFGPDRCGPDSRVHVILNLLNPVSQDVVEHHLMSAPGPKADKLSHVYTLVLYSNHRYKVLIDGIDKGSGLLTAADFSPPIQPPEMLPDPDHVKPNDWAEEETIDDPAAVKPATWDDRRLIPDPNAQKPFGWLEQLPAREPDPEAIKPDDWDEEKHGEWLRPTIPNPACEGAPGCGPWTPPMIKNPAYKGPWIPTKLKNPDYKGPWQQRQIPNSDYFNADAPLDLMAPIIAVAFELWVTEPGYTFDSILLGKGEQGLDAAAAYMRQVWRPRFRVQYDAAMAAVRVANRPPGLKHWAANSILDLFELPLLSSLRPHAEPVLEALQLHPEMAWGALAAPLLLLALLAVSRTVSGQQAGAAERKAAEKEDQAAEEEHRQFLEDLKQQKTAAKQAAAAKLAAGSESGAVVSSPAATAIAHRRGQLKQQASDEGGAGGQGPVHQQQQEGGAPDAAASVGPPASAEAACGMQTRSTRRSARKE